MQFSLNSDSATLSPIDASEALRSHETASGLKITNGTISPSVAFLHRVAAYLRSIGLVDATPSSAWQFWYAIGIHYQQSKEKTSELSKIAFWYKLDPFELSETQQVGLLANLDRMQCQDRIHRGDFDPMDYKGVYDLFKTAFDDEDLARRKQTEAFKLYVEKCTQRQR